MRASPMTLATILALVTACSEATDPDRGAPSSVPPASLTSAAGYPLVTITPALSAMPVSDSAQLSARLRGPDGRRWTCRSCAWSSSNPKVARVSRTGLLIGMASGSSTITATTPQGTTGRMVLSVEAAAGPAVRECAVRAAGWLWCDDFEVDRLSEYFEYDNAGGRFVRATGVGVNGSYGMRSRYITTGQTSSGSLKLAVGRTPDAHIRPVDGGSAVHRGLYWRMYLKHPAGWTGGGGDKLSRATSLVSSNWAQAMIAHVWSGRAPSSSPSHLYIDPASGTDSAGNVRTTRYNDFDNLRWLGAAQAARPLFEAARTGQWYCIEAHAKLNDPGQSNGVFELWINGTLEAQQTELSWVGSYRDYGINAVFFENFWNDGSPVVQERYFDNIVVSTQRIGC